MIKRGNEEKEERKLLPPPKEPLKKDFEVKIEQPRLILEAVKKGQGGTIGHNVYEYPVEEIQVILEPEVGRFHVSVHFNPEYSEQPKINGAKLVDALTKKFPSRFVGPDQSHLIFRVGQEAGQPGTEFILDPTMFNGFSITTGTIIIANNKIEKIKAPVADSKTMANVLADLAKMIEFVVAASYRGSGLLPPQEEFVIHPPKEDLFFTSLEDRLAGSETAERLTLDKVGGNKRAKQELRDLMLAIKNPGTYKRWGTKPPKGILFIGPPGTGKTLMVKALAEEAGAKFYNVSSTDIYEMWVGNSGRNLKKIFEEARKQRSIIFFDEVDKTFSGYHEVAQQVRAVFLEHTSGMHDDPNVTIIAASNHPEDIDPAIMRSGRFTMKIEVPLPDAEGRREIFNIHIGQAEKRARRQLFKRLQWPEIIDWTHGWSGADIEAVLLQILNRKASKEALTGKAPSLVAHKELLAEIRNFVFKHDEEQKRPIGFGQKDRPIR